MESGNEMQIVLNVRHSACSKQQNGYNELENCTVTFITSTMFDNEWVSLCPTLALIVQL